MTSRVLATSGLALTFLVLSAASTVAYDRVADEFYGSGVHQYFAGNYSQANSDLSAAIAGGTKDPRAYYFRALVQMRQGQQTGAEADLRKAAILEGADVDQFYAVGKALERVQGRDRMAIERHRALARAEAYQRRRERDSVRYEQRRAAESKILRSSGTMPIAEPAAAPKPSVPVAPEVTDDDPFADKGDTKTTPAPPTPEPPGAEPPDEPSTEEMPADDTPVEEMPAEETPAAADEAAPKSNDEDPFADDPAESK
jgi:hypothetical protein